MPTYPTSPIPIPIYPAGIQGPITVVNSGDTSVSVSPISAPFSGFALSKGGSIEWPANTPLWVYGETGGLVSVGGGSGLTGAAPAPIVTVEPPVVIVNPPVTPTPGTDEDELRVLAQPQIDALTATDKSTNFTIWNTTTNAMNYVVNGEVKVPFYGGTQISKGTYTGNGAAQRTIVLPFTPDLVLVSAVSYPESATIHRDDAGATTYQGVFANGTSTAGATNLRTAANGFVVGGTYPSNSQTNAMNSNGNPYVYTAYQFQSSSVQTVKPVDTLLPVYTAKTATVVANAGPPGSIVYTATIPANSALKFAWDVEFVNSASVAILVANAITVSAAGLIAYTDAQNATSAGTSVQTSTAGGTLVLESATVSGNNNSRYAVLGGTLVNPTTDAVTVQFTQYQQGSNATANAIRVQPGSEIRTRTVSLT